MEITLAALLSKGKDAIVRKWLDRTLEIYPEPAGRFLSGETDPFRNPVGYTLKHGLSALFDGLVQQKPVSGMSTALEDIVRIRAVQGLSASRAMGFIFLLKQAIREELKADIPRYAPEMTVIENRIDETALLAFDLYTNCRQQIHDLRTKEIRRLAEFRQQEGWLVEEESIG